MTNDCLACMVRGTLDAAKLATNDTLLQQKIVKKILKALIDVDMSEPPPLMAMKIQQAVKDVTGVNDPYANIKKSYNDFALKIYPNLKKKAGATCFETAVRLCIAGNIIDFGTHTTIGEKKVLDTIEDALKVEINGQVDVLEKACKKASRILWIADNTGEIVFDKLLLEKLDPKRIVYAVRGGPTQNDATLEDAHYTGITNMVKVIDTGAAIPGVVLSYCSIQFRQHYEKADLIIAKGQGNFETMDHQDNRIFFLFKAKCPMVAEHAGCDLHDIVILRAKKEYGTQPK